ncbi:hypothetical protein COB21_02600 [Candidatus Aerophobetes bacterium]|uniref:N-acetyltransferase domain-containing protein n=1 Tax=Aerophobetes bacterium TaxID=2030807 RepID=A0A2A4X5C9_UNCAE|nr:MAG: hypothetical protein COB21_02600 [Candidatus Aerophobetes bacterium]
MQAVVELRIENYTDRLCIRAYTEEDYEDSLSIYSDPELTQFFDHGKPRSKLEVDIYLEERSSGLKKRGLPLGLFSVFLKDNSIFLGQVDVVPTGDPGEVEIGWIFRKNFQSLGYCSEAVKSFLIPFIINLSERGVKVAGQVINRIIATAHPKNKASQRIMEKMGLTFYKDALRYAGNPRNWYEFNLKNKGAEEVEIKWNPKIYSELSLAQNRAASKVLEVLQVKDTCDVLDVGCGDGKFSAKLAKIANQGFVLGLDKSVEMIDFARSNYGKEHYPNLSFSVQDAQEIDFKEEFDLVFSSFALQWFKDKALFFTRAYKALKTNGEICVVTPLAVSSELEYAIEKVIESFDWHRFYKDFHPNWYFVGEDSISNLVQESGFKISYLDTYDQETVFLSKKDFEKYVLLWFPYLKPLSEDLRESFFLQVIEKYYAMLPPQQDSSILMRVPVMSLVASKISI